jgi:hypothetical protein
MQKKTAIIPVIKRQSGSVCQHAINLKANIEQDFLTFANLLYSIKRDRLYEAEYEAWWVFLQDLRISESTASKLLRIYEVFIKQYQIDPEKIAQGGGYSNLYETIRFVTDKKSAEEWVEKASVLSRSDLRKELKEKETGKSMQECKHPKTFLVRVCEDCGHKERVYDDEE